LPLRTTSVRRERKMKIRQSERTRTHEEVGTRELVCRGARARHAKAHSLSVCATVACARGSRARERAWSAIYRLRGKGLSRTIVIMQIGRGVEGEQVVSVQRDADVDNKCEPRVCTRRELMPIRTQGGATRRGVLMVGAAMAHKE
jgi:hypothetical protein